MPKSRIPSVEVQFGGETRHLIYGHHALGELEEQAAQLLPGARIKSIVLALWAGLLTETLDSRGRETRRTLSRYQVSAILDGMDGEEIEEIANKIMEAKGMAAPEASEKPENPPVASESQA